MKVHIENIVNRFVISSYADSGNYTDYEHFVTYIIIKSQCTSEINRISYINYISRKKACIKKAVSKNVSCMWDSDPVLFQTMIVSTVNFNG